MLQSSFLESFLGQDSFSCSSTFSRARRVIEQQVFKYAAAVDPYPVTPGLRAYYEDLQQSLVSAVSTDLVEDHMLDGPLNHLYSKWASEVRAMTEKDSQHRPEDLLHEADVPAMCDELQAVAFPVARFRGGVFSLAPAPGFKRRYMSFPECPQGLLAGLAACLAERHPATILRFKAMSQSAGHLGSFLRVRELWESFFTSGAPQKDNFTAELANLKSAGLFGNSLPRRARADFALLRIYTRLIMPILPLDVTYTQVRVGPAEFWWNWVGLSNNFAEWEWMHLGLPALTRGTQLYLHNGCSMSAAFVCPHVLLRLPGLQRLEAEPHYAHFNSSFRHLLEAAAATESGIQRFREILQPVLVEIRDRCCQVIGEGGEDQGFPVSGQGRQSQVAQVPNEDFSRWQIVYRLKEQQYKAVHAEVFAGLPRDHPHLQTATNLLTERSVFCIGGDQGCHTSQSHCYPYDELFQAIRSDLRARQKQNKPSQKPQLRIMQIGICMGQSLAAMERFFRPAGLDRIIGMDLFPEVYERFKWELHEQEPFDQTKIRTYSASSLVPADVARFHRQLKADEEDKWKDVRFDIIIDDGDHTAPAILQTFRNVFLRLLKPGGFYVIEDTHALYSQSEHRSFAELWEHLLSAGPDEVLGTPRHKYTFAKEVALQRSPDPFLSWVHSATFYSQFFLVVRKRWAIT